MSKVLAPTTFIAEQQQEVAPTRIVFVPPIVIQQSGMPQIPPCAGTFVIAGDVVKIQQPGGPPAGSQNMIPIMCILNDLAHGTPRQVLINQSGGWLTNKDIDDCVEWLRKLVALVFPNIGNPIKYQTCD